MLPTGEAGVIIFSRRLQSRDEAKREQETRSLIKIQDSFKKIVVVREDIEPWHDDNGILYIGIEQFLLDEAAMDL